MTDGYCPSCDSRVLFGLMRAGMDGLVNVCSRCDNAMVFDSRREYLQRERDRLERMRNCDHEKDHRHDQEACRYCSLPVSLWDNPEETVPDDAIELTPSEKVTG